MSLRLNIDPDCEPEPVQPKFRYSVSASGILDAANSVTLMCESYEVVGSWVILSKAQYQSYSYSKDMKDEVVLSANGFSSIDIKEI